MKRLLELVKTVEKRRLRLEGLKLLECSEKIEDISPSALNVLENNHTLHKWRQGVLHSEKGDWEIMASLIGFLKRLLHEHDWEGIGRIIVLHEPTFSIYHARRTTWRRCKDCVLLERFNHVTLSYMSKERWREFCEERNFDSWLKEIDRDFTIPRDAKRHPRYDVSTTFESPELRKMYGVT